jgi:hypothetical protein
VASLVIAAHEESAVPLWAHPSSLSSGTGWFFLSTRYCHTSARARYGPGLERWVPETNEIGGYMSNESSRPSHSRLFGSYALEISVLSSLSGLVNSSVHSPAIDPPETSASMRWPSGPRSSHPGLQGRLVHTGESADSVLAVQPDQVEQACNSLTPGVVGSEGFRAAQGSGATA